MEKELKVKTAKHTELKKRITDNQKVNDTLKDQVEQKKEEQTKLQEQFEAVSNEIDGFAKSIGKLETKLV